MLSQVGKLSTLYASLILETVGILFSYWDRDQVCQFINLAHSKWFGDPRGTDEHRNINELLYQFEGSAAQRIEGVLGGSSCCFEKNFTAINGLSISCKVNLMPYCRDGKVNGFILQITPYADNIDTLSDGIRSPYFDKEPISKIAQHLLDNLKGPFPGLEELATRGLISKSKLKRDFNHHYGMPPFIFFRQQQMKYAKSQIHQGKLNKKQLAEILGFSNLSNFYKCYRRYSL